ncbi:uncharacterized protein MYCGRDRAFT_97961 [Zymoseptoria tritici IPO323]|uniref:Uncharacterized protein n=1 Tax=Zymoseptoria tritici (strain CBS 115943 / IPO323) TaxID=336722 RepID=F9XRW7_ZYMTI|nr:uncharacterized protein MYCGRDRAFT_97961 [Zymoseptoria tritici IPO323]EGP81990.1 hypothetical protein MYCGRDRAFT_97961 [Zymoseptoria tritici IPO323]
MDETHRNGVKPKHYDSIRSATRIRRSGESEHAMSFAVHQKAQSISNLESTGMELGCPFRMAFGSSLFSSDEAAIRFKQALDVRRGHIGLYRPSIERLQIHTAAHMFNGLETHSIGQRGHVLASPADRTRTAQNSGHPNPNPPQTIRRSTGPPPQNASPGTYTQPQDVNSSTQAIRGHVNITASHTTGTTSTSLPAHPYANATTHDLPTMRMLHAPRTPPCQAIHGLPDAPTQATQPTQVFALTRPFRGHPTTSSMDFPNTNALF